ncbi:MAG: TIR domain-containing protein [Sedimentisphaeraceae bacterium JB056]
MGGGGGSFSSSDLNHLENVAKNKLSQNGDGKRHVFISFAHEDLGTVNMLRGQAKNEDVSINFDDHSVKTPFNSKNAEYIKTQIRSKIDRSSVTVVYLSSNTASSQWVNWEINESIRKGKGVVGVYAGDKPPAQLPSSLVQNKCKIVRWSHEGLGKAIEDASNSR